MYNIFRLLNADEIEVKVKQVTEKGAIALLYKTARTDMDLLDETFGSGMWECDYKEIKGNLYCGIGVKQADGTTIWKWDCGIESRADDEGNEKKGEASDAFKRAGTKWGIGRELYAAPFIFLDVPTEANGKAFRLVNKYQTFDVAEIEYDDNRKINKLVIKDNKGKVVYSYGRSQVNVQSKLDNQIKEQDTANREAEENEKDAWTLAFSRFLESGGNPEKLAAFCGRASAELLSVEELEIATKKRLEAKAKAANV